MTDAQASAPATLSEIARYLDLAPQTVQEAQRNGQIGLNVDLETAKRQWLANTDPNQAKKAYGAVASEADLLPLAREKLRHEVVKRQLAELELARQLKQVVDAAAVREAGAELAEQLRQGLEQLLPDLIQAIDGARSVALKDRAGRVVLERWRGEFAAMVEQRCRELTEV